MPLEIIRNDILKMEVDAIVNPTDGIYSGSGGTDFLIHKAAGPGLDAECSSLELLEIGSARVSGGYDLPCRYIIHTAGPLWQSEEDNEELAAAYRSALEAAVEKECASVAVPLISTGSLECPRRVSMKVALDVISSFLLEHELLVYIVLFDRESLRVGSLLFRDIASYIDDRYAEAVSFSTPRGVLGERVMAYDVSSCSLDSVLENLDEGFSERLLRLIREKGISEVECYKKANIDRKLFSKIRSDKAYRPSKQTVLAFAIALELPRDEMDDLLLSAGFALSHSSKADIIVEYFINEGNYNIHEINEALFAFDQSLIGGVKA